MNDAEMTATSVALLDWFESRNIKSEDAVLVMAQVISALIRVLTKAKGVSPTAAAKLFGDILFENIQDNQ